MTIWELGAIALFFLWRMFNAERVLGFTKDLNLPEAAISEELYCLLYWGVCTGVSGGIDDHARARGVLSSMHIFEKITAQVPLDGLSPHNVARATEFLDQQIASYKREDSDSWRAIEKMRNHAPAHAQLKERFSEYQEAMESRLPDMQAGFERVCSVFCEHLGTKNPIARITAYILVKRAAEGARDMVSGFKIV